MKFINKFGPKDIVAIIVLVGCFILKLKGADGTVSLIMTAVVSYYFVKRVEGKDNGQ